MSRRSGTLDNFTRRKVVAGGLGSIMGVGWFLTSVIQGQEASNTPTPVNSGNDGGQAGLNPQNQTGEAQAPQDQNQTGGTSGSQDTPQLEPPDPGDERRPGILLVSLLSEWKGGNQMEQNQIDSVSKGKEAIIGYRYQTVPNDGEIQLSISIDVAGEARNRTVSRTAEGNTPVIDEYASRFKTTDWSTGTTQATVVIRNENTGYVSSPVTTEFEVTEG